ncbi:neuropeptide-like protein 30 [Folsomia candida]|uniref:Uncharacterized protein n=1 Tax=Folsomia candida TaxID=158441 RepID=A0A226F5X9_FOLCA|nr:neuropeptide-like protein 30 [Folsomia candida]OXA64844.1 hypothetical protein Fcan01_01275 [Folsomia candida]
MRFRSSINIQNAHTSNHQSDFPLSAVQFKNKSYTLSFKMNTFFSLLVLAVLVAVASAGDLGYYGGGYGYGGGWGYGGGYGLGYGGWGGPWGGYNGYYGGGWGGAYNGWGGYGGFRSYGWGW